MKEEQVTKEEPLGESADQSSPNIECSTVQQTESENISIKPEPAPEPMVVDDIDVDTGEVHIVSSILICYNSGLTEFTCSWANVMQYCSHWMQQIQQNCPIYRIHFLN